MSDANAIRALLKPLERTATGLERLADSGSGVAPDELRQIVAFHRQLSARLRAALRAPTARGEA